MSPARAAIQPAFWAGMMLATAAFTVSPPSVVTVIAAVSTFTTRPPNSAGTHSTMPA
ncbi:hypothetical protein HRbin39_01903 [bacterium HR39]|nr:hypothetical protein HRbin39_01903 [bacterium HR39]